MQEHATAAGVDAHFNYIALTTDGAFGKDSKRDGPNTNEAWKERLTAAAGGDAAKAAAKAPKLFRDITAGDLTESGKYTDDPAGWAATISAHEAALITTLTAKEVELQTEVAAAAGTGTGTGTHV